MFRKIITPKHRKYFKNTLQALLPYYVSLASLIIGVFIIWASTPKNEFEISQALTAPLLVSLLLVYLTDYTMRHVREDSRHNDLIENFNVLMQLSASSDKITCISSQLTVADLITNAAQEAISVHNTHFEFHFDETYSWTWQHKKVVSEQMIKCLDRGCIWIDVISGEDPSYNERIIEVKKKLSDKIKERRFKCYRLTSSFPSINFIVFEFSSQRKSEVFFGFGRTPDDERGKVFYTSDHNIVEYFLSFHRTLRRPQVSEAYQPSIGKGYGKFESIQGLWKSIGRRNNILVDTAVVEIRFNRGAFTIKGYIFESRFTNSIASKFHTSDVLYSNDKLLFLYFRVKASEVIYDVKALSVYEFMGSSQFSGKVFDVVDSEPLDLEGFRLTKEEEEAYYAENWGALHKIIFKEPDHHQVDLAEKGEEPL